MKIPEILGSANATKYTKIKRIVKINVDTIASIFLNPSFIIPRSKNTSRTVMKIAPMIGIPNKRFKAMADPSTSAKSVAISANSTITHKM